MKPDPAGLERATEAYVRELTQRPDQVVGDFVAAIVRAYVQAAPPPMPHDSTELAALVARYYRQEIGRLMHQAEHWAANDKPLAVLHRIHKADAYYQVVALMERDPLKGWPSPFTTMAAELSKPPADRGTYPPGQEIQRYADPVFVAKLLEPKP